MKSDYSEIISSNCYVEINTDNLAHNASIFRALAGSERKLAAVVKANAYGHGMVETAKTLVNAGADWLAVFSIEEGLILRNGGIDLPILVLGPPSPGRILDAVHADLRLTAASPDTALRIAEYSRGRAAVHLKIETGTNRQGLRSEELISTAKALADKGVFIEGAYTHFADIEDTTDHAFAETQLSAFKLAVDTLRQEGHKIPIPHTACSAAAILFPDTYFQMLRVGIALYGLWPSRETKVSAKMLGRNDMDLRPVMSAKTYVSQIHTVEKGQYVGYGRSFRTTRDTRIAVLPVGYADGYDRALSNRAHVLIRGVRAPVRGRICMNLTMVDVTDIEDAVTGDEAVLLGSQGKELITSEFLAETAGTINYEIVTRIMPHAERVFK